LYVFEFTTKAGAKEMRAELDFNPHFKVRFFDSKFL